MKVAASTRKLKFLIVAQATKLLVRKSPYPLQEVMCNYPVLGNYSS